MLYIIAFVAGLIVGWNLLPQPAWVKRLYDRAANWIADRRDAL